MKSVFFETCGNGCVRMEVFEVFSGVVDVFPEISEKLKGFFDDSGDVCHYRTCFLAGNATVGRIGAFD